MTIHYVTRKDILDDASQTIVIPVNTVGVPGAGLAKAWAEFDPTSAGMYRSLCKKKEVRIGKVTVLTLGDFIWLLFPTNENWQSKSRIEWINLGLSNLRETVDRLSLQSLAVPALGCGCGGLAWRDVKPLLEASLSSLQISINIYPPQ